jgi:hypothetical protein
MEGSEVRWPPVPDNEPPDLTWVHDGANPAWIQPPGPSASDFSLIAPRFRPFYCSRSQVPASSPHTRTVIRPQPVEKAGEQTIIPRLGQVARR